MGMFDTVIFSMSCPFCQEVIPDFQSKDGECTLSELKPSDVRSFYSSCPKCNAWVECVYVPPAGVGKIIATGRNSDNVREVVEIDYPGEK